MRGFKKALCLLAMGLLVGLWTRPPVLAEDKPHYGGELRVALAGDPPSLDMHQEQTFMVTILRCGKVDIESLECLKPTRPCPMLSSSIKEVGDGEHQVVGTAW